MDYHSPPRPLTDIFDLDPPVEHFAGREELFAAMRQRLNAPGETVRTVVLTGLGGVGKTTAAGEYAHRHLNEYGLVCRFHAEDHALLVQQLRKLASHLDPQFTDRQDPMTTVYSALAARTSPWLLILDNVPTHEIGRLWLPHKGRGHVIVTTRDGNWPQAIPVAPLTPEAAKSYLLDATGQSDEPAAAAISELVGGLPLALAQAASYVRTTGTDLDKYLKLLRERRRDMLGADGPPDHTASVELTWSVATERLETTSPAALAVLLTCAFLAPDDIPHELVFTSGTRFVPATWGRRIRALIRRRAKVAHEIQLPAILPRAQARALVQVCADPLILGDAIGALRDYSLISEPGRAKISVHRLVQTVIRDRLPDGLEHAWSEVVAGLLESAVPEEPDERASWQACADLLPHVRTRLGPLSPAMWSLADGYLRYAGQYSTAREVWTDIARAHAEDSRHGPEHSDTLTARAHLAYWTGATGNPQDARDQYTELLPIVQRVFGRQGVRTLSVRGHLARWTGEAGQAEDARVQYAELLPVVENIYGHEHAFTFSVRGNLAQWTGEAGDAAGARDQYAALLPAAARVLGADHRDSLAVRANLAYWTGATGDPSAARDRYAELLPVIERVLGAEHRETLAVRADLAHWSGAAGDASAARDGYAALVPVAERVLGPEHPDTLIDRANLAYWEGAVGHSSVARDLYAALLPVAERVLGPTHRQTNAVHVNLTRWREEREAAGDH